jgi:hypothetical protein
VSEFSVNYNYSIVYVEHNQRGREERKPALYHETTGIDTGLLIAGSSGGGDQPQGWEIHYPYAPHPLNKSLDYYY